MAAWLADNRDGAPHNYGPICPPDLIDAGLAWQHRINEAGYAGVHWPVEHGGMGLTVEHNGVWLLECARAGVPPFLNMVGFVLAGGAIQRFGTPEQQAAPPSSDAGDRPRLVPALLRAGRGQRPRVVDAPGRNSTATGTSSTARRCGARAAGTATGAS